MSVGTLYSTKYPNNSRVVSGVVNIYEDDSVLLCDTSSAPVVINLLQIPSEKQTYTSSGNWSTQYKLYIIDYSGNAATNNITVHAPNGFKINSVSSQVININNEALVVEIVSNLDYIAFSSIISSTPPTPPLIIADEGISLPNEPVLNFVGAGVTVTNGPGSQNVVTIPGILGRLLTGASLVGRVLDVAPIDIRSPNSGTIQDGYSGTIEQGTLNGSFDNASGAWTCPVTGYYDLTIQISLSANNDYNALNSPSNLNGFMSVGVNTFSIPSTPATLDFNDYLGQWFICYTDATGGTAWPSASQYVSFNTSHVQISASYTGRLINQGTVLYSRWLNKCKNPITGMNGNHFHLSITHTQ